MRRITCLVVASFTFLLCINQAFADSLTFDSRFSTIKVNSGATFSINNSITDFEGRLVKNSGATLSGQTITFANGQLFARIAGSSLNR